MDKGVRGGRPGSVFKDLSSKSRGSVPPTLHQQDVGEASRKEGVETDGRVKSLVRMTDTGEGGVGGTLK